MDKTQHESNLNRIFNREEPFLNPELENIRGKGYRFCPIKKEADILIVGINPSLRKNDNHIGGRDFCFDEAFNSNDRYFKKFREMFEGIDSDRLGYTDLFYHRRTSQADLKLFKNDDVGLKFLCDQLVFTREKIEWVAPKLICVFNRKAAEYFGVNAKEKKGKTQGVWMGYDFAETKWPEVKRVVGVRNMVGRIGSYPNSTNLAPDTLVFFSRFLGNGMSRKEGERVKEVLSEVRNEIF
jgi:hypothetical protein